MKRQKLRLEGLRIQFLGCVSVAALGVIMALAICPVNIDSTSAQDSANLGVMLSVNPSISVGLGGDVSMELTSTSNGQFSYGVTTLDVTTSNPTGYAVYLRTADGKPTLNGANSDDVVDSITTVMVGNDFVGNVWGYTLGTGDVSGGSNYRPIPTSSNASVYETNSASVAGQTDTYNLGFGVHIDDTLSVGTYSNEVIVSAVANPIQVDNLLQLTYMQDMKPELCENSSEGMERRLVDTRDGRRYFVTKLKDGHCWMTQNLAYEFKEGVILTPEDSDVTEDWEIPVGMKEIGVAGSTSSTSIEAWEGQDVEYGRTGHAAFGNYYSFGAATAGSGNSITSGEASSSICPKGWRLPTSGSTQKELGVLTTKLAGDTIQESPYYFVLARSVQPSSGLLNTGYTTGLYRSSTARIELQAYYLSFTASALNASAYGDRSTGASVRCITK